MLTSDVVPGSEVLSSHSHLMSCTLVVLSVYVIPGSRVLLSVLPLLHMDSQPSQSLGVVVKLLQYSS